MRYLSDTFVFSAGYPTGQRPSSSGQMLRYEVCRVDAQAQQEDDNSVIFSGNYYVSSIYRYNFDITEIIRNVGAYSPNQTSYGDYETSLIETYYMRIWYNASSYFTTSEFNLARVYIYPNQDAGGWMVNPNAAFFDPSNSTLTYYRPLSQGFRGYNRSWALMPRYPLLDEQVYGHQDSNNIFSVQFEVGGSIQDGLKLVAYNAGDNPVDDDWVGYATMSYINYEGCVHAFWNTLDGMLAGYTYDWYGRDIIICLYDTASNTYTDIARLQACPSRYYLQWQDRWGSMQSQPFGGKAVYSETITNNEVQNYNNVRRKASVVVQPKWSIYSGWIREDLFPIYESIYVSPYLKLYDAVRNITYDVIINDNFTEKKYSQEKAMLNLKLDIEATSKQNILY